VKFIQPHYLLPGDKVAIISPSAGLPYLFPWVYEQGLRRIKEVFDLEPIEFPTARQSPEYLSKNPQARADDINAAFADKSIKAIIATIGGNDQIRILPYLDKKVISENPKIFMGYSDCTNLHIFLWNLGVISYYGGAVMTQFAMGEKMHEYTIDSIKKALFDPRTCEIHAAPEWSDADLDWADPQNLRKNRPMYKSEGWQWHNNSHKTVQGRLWGGCLEVLDLHLSVKRYLPAFEQFDDTILFLETSEEMPTEGFVYRFIAALGELGILQKLKAILMAYPKAQFCGSEPPEGREQFILNQQTAVKNALVDYDSDIPVIFNMNFGHTDPQMIIPNGGRVLIDGAKKMISYI
jgi:muramoyltetrapeptide carboxypeptidase LdcA involved in peptidoglycan recycling